MSWAAWKSIIMRPEVKFMKSVESDFDANYKLPHYRLDITTNTYVFKEISTQITLIINTGLITSYARMTK